VSDRAAFVARYGPLFEHSPWVAEQAWEDGPFDSPDALHAALVAVVRRAPREAQLALIRAHPDLAGRAAVAGELTADSTREQASAGLDRLTGEAYAELTAVTAAYRERFGFPFVLCVRGHDAASILAAARERLGRDGEAEVATALGEIARIAWLRLEDLA
jgi:2-oxo-4-hydroxy-4-carboxy-5-ureidoimidazoline decarboxylase